MGGKSAYALPPLVLCAPWGANKPRSTGGYAPVDLVKNNMNP